MPILSSLKLSGFLHLFFGLLMLSSVSACSSDSGLTGNYTGIVNGQNAMMTLYSDGSRLKGNMRVGNYQYTLQGNTSGGTSSGKLIDMQGKSLDFTLAGAGNRLTFTLIQRNPFTGQVLRQVPMAFTRAGTGNPSSPRRGIAQNNSAGQIDRALVGRWRYSKIYRSGSFSTTTTRYMTIYANGTYQYGGGRLYVSDVNASGRSGRSNVETGRWKVANRIIYVAGMGGGNWQPYARYFVKGNSMMLTFGNGSRQLWSRY